MLNWRKVFGILYKLYLPIPQGRSKKIAKLNLAKTILLCMYDIHDFKDADSIPKSSQNKNKTDETQMEKKFPLTQLKTLAGWYAFPLSRLTLSTAHRHVFIYLWMQRNTNFEGSPSHNSNLSWLVCLSPILVDSQGRI